MELIPNSKSSDGEKEANHALPNNRTVCIFIPSSHFLGYRNAMFRNLPRHFNKLSNPIFPAIHAQDNGTRRSKRSRKQSTPSVRSACFSDAPALQQPPQAHSAQGHPAADLLRGGLGGGQLALFPVSAESPAEHQAHRLLLRPQGDSSPARAAAPRLPFQSLHAFPPFARRRPARFSRQNPPRSRG